ncbi:hypothetical protein ACFPZ0_03970 [Streptomonospora nanhaiensis]|uniref:Uncharacterized protein n=1 Tax=Streptomonospora nanhaiensis TaxID=1323731 RepID=A0A853BRQ3_9ACTN|nr:hypothetical protein [Streptomonospora nanhaiensis]MBV2362175.1 hypothetical protein [Streptomonospora nanhaiensis]MBX9388176.1 hypothetical protein [Streptomonospora nanhaiensis]NYI97386.1 hypothetical protein [Streptomonospora nanhaiensis]
MIGRWTIAVAVACALVMGYFWFTAYRADGWSLEAIVFALLAVAMLDGAWVFHRLSRNRRRAAADGGAQPKGGPDGDAENGPKGDAPEGPGPDGGAR